MMRQWFRAVVVLWGLILVLGVLGTLLNSDTLAALGIALRRLALAVTLLWLIFSALGSALGTLRNRLHGAARRRR